MKFFSVPKNTGKYENLLHLQIERDEEGLETTTLGLRFKVRDKHFKDGDLKLKCTATIANIYWKSNEESVQGVRTQSALVSESRSSRNSPGKFTKLYITSPTQFAVILAFIVCLRVYLSCINISLQSRFSTFLTDTSFTFLTAFTLIFYLKFSI